MQIEQHVGNVFNHLDDVQAFAHGVNTVGAMGAGVAKAVKAQWPQMYPKYRQLCQSKTLQPAMVWPWLDEPKNFWVYNLATQDKLGAHARLEWVRTCVTKMMVHAQTKDITRIATVQLGSGIGGLDWDEVYSNLTPIETNIVLVVYNIK